MDYLVVLCAGCMSRYRVTKAKAGTKVRCPKCSAMIRVPGNPIAEQPAEIKPQLDVAAARETPPAETADSTFDLADTPDEAWTGLVSSGGDDAAAPNELRQMGDATSSKKKATKASKVQGGASALAQRLVNGFWQAPALSKVTYIAVSIAMFGSAAALVRPYGLLVVMAVSGLLIVSGITMVAVGFVWAFFAGLARNPGAMMVCFIFPTMGGAMMGDDFEVMKFPLGLFFRGLIVCLIGILPMAVQIAIGMPTS